MSDAPNKPRWQRIPRRLFYFLVGIASLTVISFVIWQINQVDPNPDAIVTAMMPTSKHESRHSDDEIIRAIRRYGDLNGFSERHQLSFISATLIDNRQAVLKWLLDAGADPNPTKGEHPLELTFGVNPSMVDYLMQRGCKWSTKKADGRTVREAAAAREPDFAHQLPKMIAKEGVP